MKTSKVLGRALLSAAFVFAAGCGVENSLVGGQCKAGYVPAAGGGTCVPELPNVLKDAPGVPEIPAPTATTPTPKPPSPTETRTPPLATPPIEAPPVITDPLAPIAPPGPLLCDAPAVECRGVCTTLSPTDAQNCGACGKICPSNICLAGTCQGATPGDVVVIGHDYAPAFIGSAQQRVLVNAVSIPTSDPIRVAIYQGAASNATADWVESLVTAGVSRKVNFTRVDATYLEQTTLAQAYDVVLLHDGADADPTAMGTQWQSSLATFTQKGGVVVALDGGTTDMPTLLTSASLLTIGSHTRLSDATHLTVTAPGDVVGSQVISPYASYGATVSFGGTDAETATRRWVVRDSNGFGDPVVIHRVVQ